MKKQRHYADTVAEPAAGMWSNCLRVGDQIFIAGLTSRGLDGKTILGDNEYEQAKVIFQKIKDLVETAGAVMDDVVKLTLYVTDIKNNEGVWKARQEFFTGDFPAAALVEVSALADPKILVEIEAIAVAGCSSN
ncbi:enamine deaminase RidA [Enteractinococcus helveticum]|uniref:Enamine deaminase RidA n=1 Tax=Enteractinococcus helveticum TaxID=1837282 RepID=A0A1B7LV89_9MICC|nr:enamine deaminase RidA [Enteractinococcus helveticum]